MPSPLSFLQSGEARARVQTELRTQNAELRTATMDSRILFSATALLLLCLVDTGKWPFRWLSWRINSENGTKMSRKTHTTLYVCQKSSSFTKVPFRKIDISLTHGPIVKIQEEFATSLVVLSTVRVRSVSLHDGCWRQQQQQQQQLSGSGHSTRLQPTL